MQTEWMNRITGENNSENKKHNLITNWVKLFAVKISSLLNVGDNRWEMRRQQLGLLQYWDSRKQTTHKYRTRHHKDINIISCTHTHIHTHTHTHTQACMHSRTHTHTALHHLIKSLWMLAPVLGSVHVRTADFHWVLLYPPSLCQTMTVREHRHKLYAHTDWETTKLTAGARHITCTLPDLQTNHVSVRFSSSLWSSVNLSLSLCVCPSVCLSVSHTHTHTHAHTNMHAHIQKKEKQYTNTHTNKTCKTEQTSEKKKEEKIVGYQHSEIHRYSWVKDQTDTRSYTH